MQLNDHKNRNVPMKLKIILFIIISLLIVIAFYAVKFDKIPLTGKHKLPVAVIPDKSKANSVTFEKELRNRLASLEVTQSNTKRRVFKEDSTIEIKASIPRGRPMEWVVWIITSKLDQTGYFVEDCFYENEEKGCRIQFKCKESHNPAVILHLLRSSTYFSHTAKMAIFIEDFGFQADQKTVEYLSFSEPLTIGLIPSKKLTTWTAQIANEYKKEIVIMLPMEPVPVKLSKQTGSIIMVHYPEERIRKILSESMESIPHFSGITNYFGSNIINDSRVMSLVFSEFTSKKAYFLLNPQLHRSSISSIAAKYDIPHKPVDMYIDTSSSVSALQDTLRHCAMVAQKTGDIIVSSKPSAAFIKALKSELPVLKHNGIKLVYVSDLMPKRSTKK